LALPVLTTSARIAGRARRRCSRHTCTGAAQKRVAGEHARRRVPGAQSTHHQQVASAGLADAGYAPKAQYARPRPAPAPPGRAGRGPNGHRCAPDAGTGTPCSPGGPPTLSAGDRDRPCTSAPGSARAPGSLRPTFCPVSRTNGWARAASAGAGGRHRRSDRIARRRASPRRAATSALACR
jgi:hypothetical protein